MLIPVRCFSCGKPVGHLWEKFCEKISNGKKPDSAMKELGLEIYCCRRMFVSHKDYIDDIIKFKGK